MGHARATEHLPAGTRDLVEALYGCLESYRLRTLECPKDPDPGGCGACELSIKTRQWLRDTDPQSPKE